MQVKSYTKKELALAYSPAVSMTAALNRLASWIKTNKALSAALEQTGYQVRQRVFTCRQVELIFEYLGQP